MNINVQKIIKTNKAGRKGQSSNFMKEDFEEIMRFVKI
jgi:hypothetical protein